jgi:hypothetical protein
VTSGSFRRLVLPMLMFGAIACSGDSVEADATGDVEIMPQPLVDPLSMPAEATLSLDDFAGSAVCAACHPGHVKEWETSAHAYAMVDPVFRALVRVRQKEKDGREDAFCNQCHSNIGTRARDVAPGFDYDALAPITLEGVTCESCHRVTGLEREFNSGHVLDPLAPMGGSIKDPAPSAHHESRYDPLFETSRFCSGCHDVVELDGLNLERPFAEWSESPAKSSGTHCQNCHMPKREAIAAVGGPPRSVSSHRFLGVALPLFEGFIKDPAVEAELDLEIQELLESAAELTLTAAPTSVALGGQLDVVVTIHNRIEAHNLPTGTTFLRQLWLDLTATDATGRKLYRTGQLDENGDLLDYWSELDPYGDPDLLTLNSRLVDERGQPTLFPWVATEHISTAIAPGHHRTHTLFVPLDDEVKMPVTITATLRFRSVPPYLLRALDLHELLGRVIIRDIATAVLQVSQAE